MQQLGDSRPGARPFLSWTDSELRLEIAKALESANGPLGAHCIHELWMRGADAAEIDSLLERLWAHAAASVPDWLPMRHVEWLAVAYEVAARFRAQASGRANVYLVLLDYPERAPDCHGLYVGVSRYSPAVRFDQHKAGIRHAGSVLRRGLEVLTGPTLHLQHIARAEALDIEERLAAALRAAGIFIKGGH